MEPNTWENIEPQYTIDRVLIVPGLRVWNYNLDADVVGSPQLYSNPNESLWFITEKGIFDGSRLWYRHPVTNALA